MLFSKEEETRIVSSIQLGERGTSGEIRLYVEDFCLVLVPDTIRNHSYPDFHMGYTKVAPAKKRVRKAKVKKPQTSTDALP